MKTARTANAQPAHLRPLPVLRLKPISAEKLIAFEERFGPLRGIAQ